MEQTKRKYSKFNEKEISILKLLTLDYSNEEISTKLNLRLKSVEKYIEKLKIKFYATSRTNLAVKAVQLFLWWISKHG